MSHYVTKLRRCILLLRIPTAVPRLFWLRRGRPWWTWLNHPELGTHAHSSMSAFKTTTVFFSGAYGFSVLPSCLQSAIYYSEISLQLYTFLFSHLHIAFLPNHFFSTYTSWNRFEHIFSHVVNCTSSGKNVKSLSHALSSCLNKATLQESGTKYLLLAIMLI